MSVFGYNLQVIEEEIRRINDLNGWVIPKNAWEQDHFIPTKLCLLHSEVSEALEGFRKNDFENFKEELADIFIRLLDLSTGLNIDMTETVLKKLVVLKERKFKHGNKRV